MKCHYCVDGKITLFTSVVDCEHCSGDKYSDGHVATFSAEAVKKYEDEILLPVPNTVSKRNAAAIARSRGVIVSQEQIDKALEQLINSFKS